MMALVFLVPFAFVFVLMILAIRTRRKEYKEALLILEQPAVETLNPPGPRYF